jgi:hypothetical protein
MPLTKIQSLGITDGTIVNADINASAAIAGTKLSGAGKVLQVISTVKVDTFTTASTSLVDITGLSVSITPSSASNKVLVIVQFHTGNDSGGDSCYFSLLRGATAIGGGTAASLRPSGFTMALSSNTSEAMIAGGHFLDSPSTTSATTYKIQMRVSAGTG